MTEKRVELMVPSGKSKVSEKEMADRFAELDGKVLGVLCNRKHNADRLLNRLVELLSEKYSFTGTFYREKGAATPAPEPVIAELKKECDLILNAVGD